VTSTRGVGIIYTVNVYTQTQTHWEHRHNTGKDTQQSATDTAADTHIHKQRHKQWGLGGEVCQSRKSTAGKSQIITAQRLSGQIHINATPSHAPQAGPLFKRPKVLPSCFDEGTFLAGICLLIRLLFKRLSQCHVNVWCVCLCVRAHERLLLMQRRYLTEHDTRKCKAGACDTR
jgi:hypothetical protein